MPYRDDENIEPSRILSSSGPAWLIYVLVFFIAVGLGSGAWYALAAESMARVFGRLNQEPLKVETLTLSIDGQAAELPPNGAIEIHPAQRFGIVGLSSNRWQNYDLRLASPDIDIKAVSGGAVSAVRDLLPNESFENTREIYLTIRDKDQDVADFRILSRYSTLDFVARGDAANEPTIKAEHYIKAYQLDPDSVIIRHKLVEALAEVGKTNGALAASIYESLLAQSSSSEEILSWLADVYEAEDKNDRLITVLDRLIEKAESRGDQVSSLAHQKRLAGAKGRAGQFHEAVELYEKLLLKASEQEKIAYLWQLLSLYRQISDSKGEIESLTRLAEITPPEQVSDIWAEISLVYEKTEDAQGKIAVWENLVEKLPDGASKANAYKMIGRLLVQEKKYSQAGEAYQAALKMSPDDVNILMNLARLAFLENNSGAYISNLNKIIVLEPDNIEYRLELADALVAAKQNAKAKSQYEEILKRRPDDQNLRLVYVDFLEKTGDRNALIPQYGALIKAEPSNKIIPYNLGHIYFDQKNWNKAIDSFKKVLELDSEDIDARKYLLLAYQHKNQQADILREAMEIYRRDPSEILHRTLMFNTYENAKDWKGFANVAEAVTRLEPDSPFGWEQLYKAQTHLGQKEPAAESLWQIAERTKNKKTEAWLRSARAFSTLGKNERVGQAYRKVLEIDPKNSQATKALAGLEK